MAFSKRGLRGLDIDRLMEQVRRTESRLGLGRPSGSCDYRRVGSWLVERAYLFSHFFGKVPGYAGGRIPDFCVAPTARGFTKALGAYLTSEKILCASSAQAVRIKNNVRGFYIERSNPFSTKVLISGTRTVADMKNEIRIREKVEGYRTLKVPKILEYDTDHDPPFFCEELISGRKANRRTDGNLISENLCPGLWATYERYGITFKKIEEVVDTGEALKKLAVACGMLPWHPSWKSRQALLDRAAAILEKNTFLPCSIGHGDLSLGNMIVGPAGRIYLTDWESAREMPIAFDLYAILNLVPETKGFFESKMAAPASDNPDRQVLPFADQCLLSVLVRIMEWEQSREYLRKIGAGEDVFKGKLARNLGLASRYL